MKKLIINNSLYICLIFIIMVLFLSIGYNLSDLNKTRHRDNLKKELNTYKNNELILKSELENIKNKNNCL